MAHCLDGKRQGSFFSYHPMCDHGETNVPATMFGPPATASVRAKGDRRPRRSNPILFSNMLGIVEKESAAKPPVEYNKKMTTVATDLCKNLRRIWLQLCTYKFHKTTLYVGAPHILPSTLT